MPDITDQILAATNPLEVPLRPTVQNLEEYDRTIQAEILDSFNPIDYLNEISNYDEDLTYEGNQITLEWATNEILGHRMGWVRVGLVAERVRRYRLYRPKFSDWKAYCQQALGEHSWQISKKIDAALAVMALVREGFDILPTCMSQAQKLIDCCKKSQCLIVDAWYEVTKKLPDQLLITAPNIGEVLGYATKKTRITLPKELRERLSRRAMDEGITIEQKLTQFLDDEEGIVRNENGEIIESEETIEELEEMAIREERWIEDLELLRQERKHQEQKFWFIAAIARLVEPIREKVSQFAFLREAKLAVT